MLHLLRIFLAAAAAYFPTGSWRHEHVEFTKNYYTCRQSSVLISRIVGSNVVNFCFVQHLFRFIMKPVLFDNETVIILVTVNTTNK